MRHSKSGIGRSLDVYYRDLARTERMDRLNSHFVSSGDLVFDIGAHVGDRTASFLRLGATVVSLEPQPRVFRALRLIHGRNPQATLRAQAVGAVAGELEMFLNSENPTISTLSPDLIAAAQNAQGWKGQTWDARHIAPVVTLDQLVTTYGSPGFVKIDVEGHEAEVLAGLSAPLPLLSFEFTTIQRDVAHKCIARLSGLGDYKFNLSFGEDHTLVYSNWTNAGAISAQIAALPESANSGDIYARLVMDNGIP
ncbi:FkbM family methyltransferase [Sulfitobacter guttiformis]|uniref:FkbM family methyltransferase n=1 Tax=Sulfitobacter guttiformis TaxID=74349 RepID=A0A420DTR9_9RHOB|nr:FkbM family methyltransferase [Sulfitobacter guttiformis]KIN71088.1 Methyltransferase FkbM [Sulfitobacter guttiformis KCTC 32187]RKE97570.1 FkbM family methyltransferase [Sulfitobacter guttiformis]